ncbi:MAG: UDP-N-acetylmuramate--L-alanine ligase [Chloroflexi bacterium]|nr:UDP-N-acetylmuramate--L-alanine ligase [Chloroflexota bacterium]
MSGRRVHLIGIGGIGLSAIAQILLARGYAVTGSDLAASPVTKRLSELGARVFIGHRAENVGQVDLVLVTSAAPSDNVEVAEAKRRGIRIATRYDFFPEITAGKTTIAVAGTHGKTTTTGMIASILIDAGLDPDVIVGGMIPGFGNARAGNGEHFVVEADEYGRAFLGLNPKIAVVTSIEMDHPDTFRNVEQVGQAFQEFVARVPGDGLVIGCGDSPRVAQLLDARSGNVARYGFGEPNDWRAVDVKMNPGDGSEFSVLHGAGIAGAYGLSVPGRHNVLNAVAAVAVADRLGIDSGQARETLRKFAGAGRRFQVRGDFRGVTVVDDYAHHPSEIRATLAAARARYPGRAVWAVFQPHTYSRTQALLSDFASAFSDADHVVVVPIFAARERDSDGVSGDQIVRRMDHPDARYVSSLDECTTYLSRHLAAGDVLILLGAGDVYRIADAAGTWLQGA